MKKTATIVASILFTFAAIAAGTSQSSNATPAAEYDGPVSTIVYQPVAAEYDGPVKGPVGESHDYKLERESCCGPQS